MSRDIKFRAWRSYGKAGWLFKDKHYYELPYRTSWFGVKLMQYTGLKDKNGLGIYEGDILRTHFRERHLHSKTVEVTWNELDACFDPPVGTGVNHEVVGNIHENPELLEDKK